MASENTVNLDAIAARCLGLGSRLRDGRRLRHCQHRKVFQETVALGGGGDAAATAATMSLGSTFGGNFGSVGGGGTDWLSRPRSRRYVAHTTLLRFPDGPQKGA